MSSTVINRGGGAPGSTKWRNQLYEGDPPWQQTAMSQELNRTCLESVQQPHLLQSMISVTYGKCYDSISLPKCWTICNPHTHLDQYILAIPLPSLNNQYQSSLNTNKLNRDCPWTSVVPAFLSSGPHQDWRGSVFPAAVGNGPASCGSGNAVSRGQHFPIKKDRSFHWHDRDWWLGLPAQPAKAHLPSMQPLRQYPHTHTLKFPPLPLVNKVSIAWLWKSVRRSTNIPSGSTGVLLFHFKVRCTAEHSGAACKVVT